jgi:hypothetical protein
MIMRKQYHLGQTHLFQLGEFNFESAGRGRPQLSLAAVQFAEHINSEIRANWFLYHLSRKRFQWASTGFIGTSPF